MKLQGIIPPTSRAVSTPTVVPVGALAATVKLLIVIGINLSGGAMACSTNVRHASWSSETAVLFVVRVTVIAIFNS
jgi:hypothetical protein